MNPDSHWKYVNERRLFVFIEASINHGTHWAVFEPNGTAAVVGRAGRAVFA